MVLSKYSLMQRREGILVANWESVKRTARRFFSKSKVRTEEALQITQLNQRLRTLRNERDEGIKKLGEEAYKYWKDGTLQLPALEELCLLVKGKEEEIQKTEYEKEEVRRTYAQKIEEFEETEKVKPEEPVEEEEPITKEEESIIEKEPSEEEPEREEEEKADEMPDKKTDIWQQQKTEEDDSYREKE